MRIIFYLLNNYYRSKLFISTKTEHDTHFILSKYLNFIIPVFVFYKSRGPVFNTWDGRQLKVNFSVIRIPMYT